MANELTPFSYAVLTLVGRYGAGPHDLVRMARHGRVYWTAADSQWYAEPKRLAKLGFLHAEKQPGRTRERTHYTLTEAGRAALVEWAAEPARFPRIQHEAVTRLLLGDMVPDSVLVAGLQSMRTEIAEITAQLNGYLVVLQRRQMPCADFPGDLDREAFELDRRHRLRNDAQLIRLLACQVASDQGDVRELLDRQAAM